MCVCVCVCVCCFVCLCDRCGSLLTRVGLLWWFGVPFVCLSVGVETVVEALVVPVGLGDEVEGFETGFPYFPIEFFNLEGCKFHV